MQAMNGIVATKNIGELPNTLWKIPIVAMTAHFLYSEI